MSDNKYYEKYIKYKKKYLELRDTGIDMYKLEGLLNNKFQKLFKSYSNPSYHKFFDSYIWYQDFLNNWKNRDKDGVKNIKKYNYDENILLDNIKSVDCKYVPKNTISIKLLEKYYNTVSDGKLNDFTKIRDIVDDMFEYNLPSTISDLPTYLNKIKSSDSINVIIVGAGPVGLYTAAYLHKYYNQNYLRQKINILLIDNRIYEEAIKLPYSRTTQFGFDISQFQPFISQIFCWKNKNIWETRQFDFIYMLENLLYLHVFKNKIPMYFTKKYETYDKIKMMAIANNFNYILDCTGGRLKPNLIGNVKWNNLQFKKDNMEVKYDGNNMYNFYIDDEKYEHITVVLYLLDNNYKPIPIGNMFGLVTNNTDKSLIKKYNNGCYKKEDYIKISKHFVYDPLRNLYPIIKKNTGIKDNDVKYIKITSFNSNSHHVNQAAKVINDNLLYCGLGDTLGSSEYGIYFGMKDSVAFSQYVCNLLGIFDK